MSVVGFDDIPEAAYFAPSLTTIRQDFEAIGRASVDQLLVELGAVATPGEFTLRPRLVTRASTAEPPR